jgi:peptidylprolyl isomerase
MIRWIAAIVTTAAGMAIAQPPRLAPIPMAELLQASPASDWRALDPENVMVIEVPAGRVIIELAPDYAPANVAAVRALVRDGYFDSSFVLRSHDNYVVQWARPETDERVKAMASRTLKAEFVRPIDSELPFTRLAYADTYAPEVGFSAGFRVARDPKRHQTWLVHCYGSVGVGRDNAMDSGNGSELYAVIGQSPRTLDRNITLVGRVVQGIELFSVMPRGTGTMGFYEKPSEWIQIRSVRMMADVPAGERVDLEALRTESRTFKALVESRANRREEWFKEPVGRIDVCSVPLPVRVKAQVGAPGNTSPR